MVKGGYQIINFNGVEFIKNIPMQLSNIYDKIEGTNKTILLSGLNVGGIDYRDVMCTPVVIGDSYVIKVFGLRIYISDIDIVTVEDEILDFGDDVDIYANGGVVNISEQFYNRFVECLKGDFRKFKITDDGTVCISNIISSCPDINTLFCVLNGKIKALNVSYDTISFR